MTTMSASQARAALPEILDRVVAGEEVTITRHGQPVAVVVRVDALQTRRASSARAAALQVQNIIEEMKGLPLDAVELHGLTPSAAEELIVDVRASRKGR